MKKLDRFAFTQIPSYFSTVPYLRLENYIAWIKKYERKYKDLEFQQVMVTLRGMAEHRLSNVHNYQNFTLLWYL